MRPARFAWTVSLLLVTLPAAGDDATDQLIAQERVRAGVESILETYLQPVSDGDVRIDMAIHAAESLADLGPRVALYLANELEQDNVQTMDLCSYALGLLGTEEAEAALRGAIARAESGNAAIPPRLLKAWATWGLGLMGQADAIDLALGGDPSVAFFSMHGKTSLLESVAIQIGTEGLPRLLAQVEQLRKAEGRHLDLRATLRALRRLGDTGAVPTLISLLSDEFPATRREAANALRTLGTPEAVKALVAALSDPEVPVRQSSALSLQYIGDPDQRKKILKHLATETDPYTRGALYRLLAETAGDRAFELLAPYADSETTRDRALMVEAMGLLDDPRRIEVLGPALLDLDNGVGGRAVLTLAALKDGPAIQALTGAVGSARIPIARTAASTLGDLGVTAAAPAITTRLADVVLSGPVELKAVLTLDKMLGALVRLGHHQALPQLREALARQANLNVIQALEGTIRQLEMLESYGDKTARWVEASTLPDRETRLLAYDRLGQIRDTAAIDALFAAFDRVEKVTEKVEILAVLGRVDSPRATALFERILLDAEFDPVGRTALRDMAAWNARLRGGDAMYESLVAAATRRNGRDVRVLIYAALVGGERILPLLESLRRPRMRLLGWPRGVEQERLDWVATRLKSGRSLAEIDVAPRWLMFR